MVNIKLNFRDLIDKKNWKTLKQSLNELDPFDVAQCIKDSDEGDDVVLFRLLNREQAKKTFQHLSHENQEQIIEGLAQNIHKLSDLLNDLDPDDRTAFFEELPGKVTQQLIQLLSDDERKIATHLLGYPENSIGRLMTPNYVAVKPHYTIEEVFAHIRQYGKNCETIDSIYVVDKNWKLLDDIQIKDIILASPNQTVSELMDRRFVALNAMEDQEMAIRVFKDYDRAFAVVNENFVGYRDFDDSWVVEDRPSFSNSVHCKTVINPLQTPLSFYTGNAFSGSRHAFVNLFDAVCTFQRDPIGSFTVFFLPLIIDSVKCGSQTASLMVRRLLQAMSRRLVLVGKNLSFLSTGAHNGHRCRGDSKFRSPGYLYRCPTGFGCNDWQFDRLAVAVYFHEVKLSTTASAPLITHCRYPRHRDLFFAGYPLFGFVAKKRVPIRFFCYNL